MTAVQGCSRPLPWLHSHEGAFGTGLGLAHYRAQINHCTEPSKPCNHPACTFCKLLGFLLPLRRSCTRSPSQGADPYLHLLHLGTVLQHSTTGGHSPGFSLQAAFIILPCLGLLMPSMTKDVVCGGCQGVAEPWKPHVQIKKGQAMKVPASGVACTQTHSTCLPKSVSAGSCNQFKVLAIRVPSMIGSRGPSGDPGCLPAGKLWLMLFSLLLLP